MHVRGLGGEEEEEKEEREGGEGGQFTIFFHVFIRKLFPVAARKEEKYRVSQMWADRQRSSDSKKKKKKESARGCQMLKTKKNKTTKNKCVER